MIRPILIPTIYNESISTTIGPLPRSHSLCRYAQVFALASWRACFGHDDIARLLWAIQLLLRSLKVDVLLGEIFLQSNVTYDTTLPCS